MPPLTNSERQRRFRQLTLKERELKADALDLLVAAIDAKQTTSFALIDGRRMKVDQRAGECCVEIFADANLQADIARARFRMLYGEE